MTTETGCTDILIPIHPLVIVGYLRRTIMFVTIDATKCRKIPRIRVAVHALIPFPLVFSTVDREILLIMVETGGLPGRFGVTILAGGREARRRVFGTVGRVVIGGMATKTGIRGIVVIPVVAGSTLIGNQSMCPIQRIIIVVDRECCRGPAGSCGVTHGTVRRNVQGYVIWIE